VQILYAIVAFGGFLGLGETRQAVPFSAMSLNLANPELYGLADEFGVDVDAGLGGEGLGETGVVTGTEDLTDTEGLGEPGVPVGEDQLAQLEMLQNAFMVNITADQLNEVPALDLENLPEIGDPNWDADIRAYWEGQGVTFPELTQDEGQTFRVSNLTGDVFGFVVSNAEGEDLGEVEDVLVRLELGGDQTDAGDQTGALAQPGSGMPISRATIQYAIVSFGGFLGLGEEDVAVPFSAMSLDPDVNQEVFYLNVSQDVFDQSPRMGGELGDINDPGFSENVDRYWETQGFAPLDNSNENVIE
jgi:hypothetical protein